MEKISILMIDEHLLVLAAWKEILERDGRFNVIGEFANVEAALEMVATSHPKIVWTEVHLLSMDGLMIAEKVSKLSPQSKLIVVSAYGHPAYVRKMMQAGARGYVTKNSSKEELIEALLEVNKGNRFICRELKQMLADRLSADVPAALSRKELQVVHGIREGLSSKEIAVRLGITTKTVQVHRYNILKKFNLKNVAALINYIHTHGI